MCYLRHDKIRHSNAQHDGIGYNALLIIVLTLVRIMPLSFSRDKLDTILCYNRSLELLQNPSVHKVTKFTFMDRYQSSFDLHVRHSLRQISNTSIRGVYYRLEVRHIDLSYRHRTRSPCLSLFSCSQAEPAGEKSNVPYMLRPRKRKKPTIEVKNEGGKSN